MKVLPGSYLSRDASKGAGEGDPGRRYIRAALVDDAVNVERGLLAIREVIGG